MKKYIVSRSTEPFIVTQYLSNNEQSEMWVEAAQILGPVDIEADNEVDYVFTLGEIDGIFVVSKSDGVLLNGNKLKEFL